MATELKELVSPELAAELAEVEKMATGYTLGDAVRDGAKLVKGQLRSDWIAGDTACVFGAAALGLEKHGR